MSDPSTSGQKKVSTAYLWWFFFGGWGAHKFYLGRPGVGLLYACTLGLLFVGLIWDLFTLPAQVRRANGESVGDGASEKGGWRGEDEPVDYARIDDMIARHRATTNFATPAMASSGPAKRAFGRRG